MRSSPGSSSRYARSLGPARTPIPLSDDASPDEADTFRVIEDIDGPDPAPNRRGHMVVVSVLLILGVLAGYAAVSSPELRGPFATPRPSAAVAPSPVPVTPISEAIPARSMILDEAQGVWFSAQCFTVAQRLETSVLVDGRPVTIGRPVPEPPPGVTTWVAIVRTGPALLWNACTQATGPSGLEFFAR